MNTSAIWFKIASCRSAERFDNFRLLVSFYVFILIRNLVAFKLFFLVMGEKETKPHREIIPAFYLV